MKFYKYLNSHKIVLVFIIIQHTFQQQQINELNDIFQGKPSKFY